MKTLVSIVFVLGGTLALDAQIATTLKRQPDGLDEVWIRNNSRANLVAFVVTVARIQSSDSSSNRPFVVYSDPVIDPAKKPLLSGEERLLMARGVRPVPERHAGEPGLEPSSNHLLDEPIVAAGILADGSTTGDAVLLARLLFRRSNVLMAVETALETLSDAGRHNIPRARLIEQLKRLADSMNRWYIPPEQQAGRVVYESLVGKLTNLPEEPVGAAFPPSTFVEQETDVLNRQRVALVESQPSLAEATLVELGAHVLVRK